MLLGRLRVLSEEAIEQLHLGVLRVLRETGLKIRGKFLLDVLADSGCRVDHGRQRAWFDPGLVEKQIGAQNGRYKAVRSSLSYPFCAQLPKDGVAWPDGYSVDYGYGTPQIYDYAERRARPATTEDQVSMIKLGNALDCVRAVNAPVICSDVDPRIETIESSRLLLMNTRKPGWVGTSSGAEVKYLADMAALAVDHCDATLRTCPPVIVNAYCTTSPLKLDTRSCEVLEQALAYKFPINIAPMPILGGTTPMTPAGSAIVAAAEILGCMTAATLIDPEIYYYCTSISAEMDMKTSTIRYATPAAVLTDAALHQLFRDRYGIVCNVEAGYVEADSPGTLAAVSKMYRQMAFASTVSCSLPLGLLDNARVFSPVQAMIDLDLAEAIYRYGQGIAVTPETMALDLINDIGFSTEKNYVESEHTLHHFRDIGWYPSVFSPTGSSDRAILDRADRRWRDLVAAQEPAERDSEFSRAVDKIVNAARRELLA